MEELGAAIKEIIHHSTIRGKFSSVHPDLKVEGITRVEVGEEGLLFMTNNNLGKGSLDTASWIYFQRLSQWPLESPPLSFGESIAKFSKRIMIKDLVLNTQNLRRNFVDQK